MENKLEMLNELIREIEAVPGIHTWRDFVEEGELEELNIVNLDPATSTWDALVVFSHCDVPIYPMGYGSNRYFRMGSIESTVVSGPSFELTVTRFLLTNLIDSLRDKLKVSDRKMNRFLTYGGLDDAAATELVEEKKRLNSLITKVSTVLRDDEIWEFEKINEA